jgi:hypothetical protein
MRIDEPDQDQTAVEHPPPRGPDWRGTPGVAGGIVIALVLTIGLALFALGRSDGPEREGHPRIVVIPNAEIALLPTLPVPRLVLTGEREIVKGQFLTTEPGAYAPEGFLLEALSPSQTFITRDGEEETTVKTRPASIFEAEPLGELVVNPSDFEAEGTSLIPPKVEPVRTEPEAVTAALRAGAIQESFFWPLLKDQVTVKCEGEAGLPNFKPEVKPHFKPNFDVRWNDAKWWKKRIETADASIEMTLSLTVQGAASASFNCELLPQRGVPIFFIAVPVGHVPVPVRVEATGALKAKATVATDEEDHLSVNLKGSTGIEYDGERVNAQRPQLELIEVSLRLPTFNPQATVGFRAKPGLAIEAGWRIPALGKAAAVAEMKLGTGVDLKYDNGAKAEAKTPLQACIPLELQGGFSFHLPGRREWGKESEPRKLRETCVPIHLDGEGKGTKDQGGGGRPPSGL